MLIINYIKKLNIINKNSFFIFYFILLSCSQNTITEEELMSCAKLVHRAGITTYNDELYSGSCIVFNKDNIKLSLMSYKKGVLEGIQKKYYLNGEVEYIGFRKYGEIHGKYIKYFTGGEKMIEGKFRRGYYIGKWKYYDEAGNIKIEKRYRNKKLIDSIIY